MNVGSKVVTGAGLVRECFHGAEAFANEEILRPWVMAGRGPPYALPRGRECHHALRVAMAGGTDAALRAGANTATCPSPHSTTAPIGR